jgi:hypothetical protein
LPSHNDRQDDPKDAASNGQTGTPLMKIRGNVIYYQSFAIALSADDLKQIKGSELWPASVNTADMDDMLDRVNWPAMSDKPSVAAMRDKLSIPMSTADALVARVNRRRLPIEVGGTEVAFLLVVHTTGHLRFYCPQQSPARLAMNDSQLADEKAELIHMMIRSGRRGGRGDEDEFGGDNRRQRLHDHRFDWSFTQPTLSTWLQPLGLAEAS